MQYLQLRNLSMNDLSYIISLPMSSASHRRHFSSPFCDMREFRIPKEGIGTIIIQPYEEKDWSRLAHRWSTNRHRPKFNKTAYPIRSVLNIAYIVNRQNFILDYRLFVFGRSGHQLHVCRSALHQFDSSEGCD